MERELEEAAILREDALGRLKELLWHNGIEFELDAPLAPLTTFEIGGPAAILAHPSDTAQVADTLQSASELGVPIVPLGGGSNILVSDKGFSGLVITTRRLTSIQVEELLITCGSGVEVPSLSEFARDNGLSGLEELCGVPGTLGGGVYMNAGCYGVSMGDLLVYITWVEPDGTVVSKPRDEVYLSYRHSEFVGSERIITEVTLRMKERKEQGEIDEKMSSIRAMRAERFPEKSPNCGSVFKRVPLELARPWVEKDGKGAYSAGYYIERAGLKGRRIGNAEISEMHANFIVNLRDATFEDVKALIELAFAAVESKYGIRLEREVIYLDDAGRH